MVNFLTRKKMLLVKEETEYGTNPTPTPAANAIDAQEITVSYQGELLERNLQRASISAITPVVGKRYAEVQFSCELKGSGSVGTAPQLGDLLEACGFTEAVAASSVTYTPSSSTHKSVTIYVYEVGDNGSAVLNKITGARGNVSFSLEAGQIARANFQMQGFYNAKTDVAAPTAATYESTKPPIVESASFSFGGESGLLVQSVSIELGNSINQDDDISAAGGIRTFSIVKRDMKGSINPEATMQSVLDYQNLMLTSTEVAMSVSVGTTAGNRVAATAPKVTIENTTQGDRNSKIVDELPIRFNADSGDDEIVIAFS
jgi:hypothetical protein